MAVPAVPVAPALGASAGSEHVLHSLAVLTTQAWPHNYIHDAAVPFKTNLCSCNGLFPVNTNGMQDIGGRAWAKCMHRDMQGAVAFTWLSSECDWAMSIGHRNYGTKHTLVHNTATVSQVSVYSWSSLAATSPAMAVGPRAVTVFVRVSLPRRQNVRGALANVHEWSLRLCCRHRPSNR